MKNNEITERVTYDQFCLLEMLSKIGILKITNWYTSGETYYVTINNNKIIKDRN